MSTMLKRFLSLVLAFTMVLSYVPVNAFAVEEEPIVEESYNAGVPGEEVYFEEELQEEPAEEPETEVLKAYAEEFFETEAEVATLDMYLEKLFWPESVPSVYAGDSAGSRLSGFEKDLYDYLKTEILKIAAGESRNTSFAIPAETLDEWDVETVYELNTAAADMNAEFAAKTAKFLGQFDIVSVIHALVTDCPYEMFWYGNAYNWGYSAVQEGSKVTFGLTVAFLVTADMRDMLPPPNDPNVTVKADVLTAAAAAKATADIVIANNDHETDLEILKHYVSDICERVSYDDTQVGENHNPSLDNDAWQILAVFDGDPDTNVVCEGYAKAFQYLCENTDFNGNVECYLVIGDAGGGHMWNIVTIDGLSYLVDVTNCDEGMIGEAVNLFLAGGNPNQDGSYTFTDGDLNTITYTYDEAMHDLLGDVLTLAESDYTPTGEDGGEIDPGDMPEGDDTEPTTYMLTQDDITAMEEAGKLFLNPEYTDFAVNEHLVIPANFTLTVQTGQTLTVNSIIESSGNIVVKNGATLHTTTGSVVLMNNADLTVENGGTVSHDLPHGITVQLETYTGSVLTGEARANLDNEDIFAVILPGNDASLRNAIEELPAGGYAGYEITISGNEVTLEDNLTIPKGMRVRVRSRGSALVVPGDVTLTNEGNLSIETNATMTINGTVKNYGTFKASGSEKQIINNGRFVNADDATLNGEEYFTGNAPETETNQVTLTLNDINGTVKTLELPLGQQVGMENIPYGSNVGPNKMFAGWFTEEGGKGTQLTGDMMVSEDMPKTYYAYYKDVVAQVGENGPVFTSLEDAISMALFQAPNVPDVVVIANTTVNSPIEVDNFLFIHTRGNSNITVTAGEGVDTVFEVGEFGMLLLNDLTIKNENEGGTVFELTDDDSGVQMSNCQITADKAAIHVDEAVVAVENSPVTGEPHQTIQVYGSSLTADAPILIDGSNVKTTIAGESPVLTATAAGGAIVMNGEDNKADVYTGNLVNETEDGVAFTLAEGCEIQMGGNFNGEFYAPNHPDAALHTVPNNGAAARVDVNYFGSLQDALDFAKDADYGDSVGENHVLNMDILSNVEATDGLTLKECKYPVKMNMAGDSVLTIPAGATFEVYEDLIVNGSIVNNGTIRYYGNWTVTETGSITGSGTVEAANQPTLTEWLENATPDQYGWYRVTEDVVVDSSTNLMLGSQYINVMVDQGGSLTVKDGGTLIIPNGSSLKSNGAKMVSEGVEQVSKITVEAGGTLYNYGYLGCDQAEITVNGTYQYGKSAKIELLFFVQQDASGYEVFMGEINGIDNSLIRMYGVDNGNLPVLEQLKAADDYADEGYQSVELWTAKNVTFTENYTLPATMTLSVDPPETMANVTVAESVTLTIAGPDDGAPGNLSLGNAKLDVKGTVVNYGEIITDIHDKAEILVESEGTLINRNSLTLNNACMEIEGEVEISKPVPNSTLYPNIMVNSCSTITVAEGGKLSNYNALHVGMWKPSAEETEWMDLNPEDFTGMAGTLNINGTMDNYGYLNVTPKSETSGGKITVNGTLNNVVYFEEVTTETGKQIIPTMGNVENRGQIVIGSDGTLNNTRANGGTAERTMWAYPSMRNYGNMEIMGTLNNTAQFWNYDSDNGAGNVTAKAGAMVNNDGSILNKSRSGRLDLSAGTYVHGNSSNAELGQEYFEDGRLSYVKVNGMGEQYINLMYEGENADTATKMYAYAERMGYKSGILTVSGDMVIPQGVEMIIGKKQIMQITPDSSVTVKGSVVNQGRINVTGKQMQYDMNGQQVTVPAAELTVAQGGEIRNEGNIDVRGMLNNFGYIENHVGNININASGVYNTNEGATLTNALVNGWTGNINGISADKITLWTSIVDSEQQLNEFLNWKNVGINNVPYGGGVVWILGDLKITGNLNVENTTLIVKGADGHEGHLTVAENKELIAEGKVYVEGGAKLTVNGVLRVAEKEHAELVGRNGAVIEINGTLVNGAKINNLSGSTIVNNGMISNGLGTFDNAGSYEAGSKAELQTFFGAAGPNTIDGIPENQVTLIHPVNDSFNQHDENSIHKMLEQLATEENPDGYGKGFVVIGKNLSLTKNLTIPENVRVEVFAMAKLTVDTSATLTNNGQVTLFGNGLESKGQIANGTGIWQSKDTGWKLKDGTLVVKGQIGEIYWDDLSGLVTRIELSNTGDSTMTSIPAAAFAGCKVSVVQLPATVTTVANGAFWSHTAEDGTLSGTTLKVGHNTNTGNHPEDLIQIQHNLVDGKCTDCDYDLNTILNGGNELIGADSGAIMDAVKEFNTEDLREAMYDRETGEETGVMDKIQEHEEIIQKSSGLEVNTHVEGEDLEKTFMQGEGIDIVGAVVNAAENVSEVKLIISEPENIGKDDLDPNVADVATAVLFSMTMEGVTDAAALDVPVKITLPIPEGIDPDRLVVKHHHGDDVEILEHFISGNFVSFYMTRFSDVELYNKTIPVTIRPRSVEMLCGENPELKYDVLDKDGNTLGIDFSVQLKVDGKVMTDLSKLDVGTYEITVTYNSVNGYTVTTESAELTVAGVCYNVQTGEYYGDLSDALEAVDGEEEETIMMLKDYSETYVTVATGTTLDLNGHTVTAKYVFSVNGANVVDSKYTGILKVAQGNITLDENNQCVLPNGSSFSCAAVWDDVQKGYTFAPQTIMGEMLETLGTNSSKLWFTSFFMDGAAKELLKDGDGDNDVRFVVQLKWEKGKEMYNMYVDYSDYLVGQVVSSPANDPWYFTLTVNGYENYSYLKGQPMIISGTGVTCVGNEFDIK